MINERKPTAGRKTLREKETDLLGEKPVTGPLDP
jgi:hypothetical protein